MASDSWQARKEKAGVVAGSLARGRAICPALVQEARPLFHPSDFCFEQFQKAA